MAVLRAFGFTSFCGESFSVWLSKMVMRSRTMRSVRAWIKKATAIMTMMLRKPSTMISATPLRDVLSVGKSRRLMSSLLLRLILAVRIMGHRMVVLCCTNDRRGPAKK